ncbi:unnamed protein product [Effrenium voratum]|nr:unnamed protein product [Effrenium voratum]
MQPPEPLALKVMHLRQPFTMAPLPGSGALVPKALIPMELQQFLVGEHFTGYLHITNTSSHMVDNVGLKVEIDIGSSKFTLLNTAAWLMAAHGSCCAPGNLASLTK